MMLSEEMKVRLAGTARQKAFEAFALVGLLAAILLPLAYWSRLPEEIPIHFNLAGEPDKWGGRGAVITPAALVVFLYIVLTGVCFLPERFINVPRGVPTRIGFELTQCMKMEMTWLIAALEWASIQVALGAQENLGTTVLVGLVIIFGTMAIYLVYMFRARRVEPRDVG
jgi:uncharacterized membrane protein